MVTAAIDDKDINKIVKFLDSHLDILENNDFQRLSDAYIEVEGSTVWCFIYHHLGINVLRYINYIPWGFFRGWYEGSILSVPENVESIHGQAFANTNIKEIFIPGRLKYISDTAFIGSNANLKVITVPENREIFEEFSDSSSESLKYSTQNINNEERLVIQWRVVM